MRTADRNALIAMLVVGLIAGFLASFIVGGKGLLTYLISGVLGAFVGSFVLNAAGVNLGIRNKFASQIVTATIGAIIVVIVAKIIA
ncbi:MAG: GlsB/YeaQ/YmgE family stress response membrane protein [Hyphomicrobiaceae bacterium]|nr:GlsB/YeaQ/YmgE family stress response membrane protein [Hyphomicrobiaceae bacterium]